MGDDDGAITCRTDPSAQRYMSGMKQEGTSHALTFTLALADPAPPARGQNTWTVRVDKGGAPQTNATLEVTPWMPKHGHGTSVVPMVTPSGSDYIISPLYFFMPGLWQVTIKASAGGVTDSAVFTFCIEG